VIYNVLYVQIKCEPYWPDEVGEPKQYGDVVVEMKSYSNIKTYDYRVFQIRNVNVLIRYVHLYYLSSLKWLCNSVMATNGNLLVDLVSDLTHQ